MAAASLPVADAVMGLSRSAADSPRHASQRILYSTLRTPWQETNAYIISRLSFGLPSHDLTARRWLGAMPCPTIQMDVMTEAPGV